MRTWAPFLGRCADLPARMGFTVAPSRFGLLDIPDSFWTGTTPFLFHHRTPRRASKNPFPLSAFGGPRALPLPAWLAVVFANGAETRESRSQRSFFRRGSSADQQQAIQLGPFLGPRMQTSLTPPSQAADPGRSLCAASLKLVCLSAGDPLCALIGFAVHPRNCHTGRRLRACGCLVLKMANSPQAALPPPWYPTSDDTPSGALSPRASLRA